MERKTVLGSLLAVLGAIGILSLASRPALAATYYVAASGSDSSDGSSKSTPWLHAPGMQSCSGSCAAASIQPGDSIIFRGGDVWHFGNSGLSPFAGSGNGAWSLGAGGSAASCNLDASAGPITTSGCVYIGVDQTWFSGSSWTRPVMDGDNPITTASPASCAYNDTANVISLGGSYVIVDNLEFRGYCWSSTSPWAGFLNLGSNYELKNSYFHGWTMAQAVSSCGSCDADSYMSVMSGAVGRMDHNVFDGSDSTLGDSKATGQVVAGSNEFDHNVLNRVSNGIKYQTMKLVHDNSFMNMYNPIDQTHGNVVEWSPVASGMSTYYFNNLTTLTNEGETIDMYPGVASSGNAGYIFNNIMTGPNGNPSNCYMIEGDNTGGPGMTYFFNNTSDAPCLIGGLRYTTPPPATFQNNHFVGFVGLAGNGWDGYFASGLTVTDNGNELYQSEAAANGQGYAQGNNYAPTSASAATVATGANLSSLCSSMDNAIAAAACRKGYGGVTYNAANHTAVDNVAAARPSSGAWDVGAYQFSGAVSASPAITSAGSASGTVGSAFSYQITASNSPTSYNASGLPAGLSVDTASGLISGTPSAAGGFSVNLSATNSAGAGTAALALSIANPSPAVALTSPAAGAAVSGTISVSGTAVDGVAISSVGVSVDGGAFAVAAGTSAWAFSLDTLSLTNGAHTLQAEVWDSAGGASTSALVNVTVGNAPAITSAGSASGTVGSAFSYQIAASNSPTSFNAAGLPAGLSVDMSNGLISGTPSASGAFNVSLGASNAFGAGQAALSLTITAASAYDDGSANAPSGPAQFPGILNGYAIRPPWKVAGVDYAVGITPGTVLKDPATISMSGVTVDANAHLVTVTAPNVTLNGYDFSLAGGWSVDTQAANTTISNSNFKIGANGNFTIYGDNGSSNLAVLNCVIDGSMISDRLNNGLIYTATPGLLVEYTLVENGFSDFIQAQDGGQVTLKYNVLHNNGNVLAHPDWLQTLGNASSPFVESIMFNTAYQTSFPNTDGTQGFMMNDNGAVLSSGELAYNTIISTPGGLVTPLTTVNGGAQLTGTALIHDNFADSRGGTYGNESFFASPNFAGVPQARYYNNHNMSTAGIYDQNVVPSPTAAVPPQANPSNPPVINTPSLTPSVTLTGGTLNGNTVTLQGTASSSEWISSTCTVRIFDGSTEIGMANSDAGGAWSFATGALAAGAHAFTARSNNFFGYPSAPSAVFSQTVGSAPSAPAVTSASSASGTVGSAFSYQITASNSPTSFGAAGLPAGLSIDAASGLISGTPSAAGTSNVTVTAGNASGTGSAALTLTVSNSAVNCTTGVWNNLEACGWPGPANTGPDLSQCPGGTLTIVGGASTGTITISAPNTVISCQNITGSLQITAQNVTIKNSIITYDGGGLDATGVVSIGDGASATVDHVELNGLNHTHACIWDEGVKGAMPYSMVAKNVNCHGTNDGIWSWWWSQDQNAGAGSDFIIQDSYLHDFTEKASNGHIDGYQTEGTRNGTITHNTFLMTDVDGGIANSAIAIWDDYNQSTPTGLTAGNITVSNNLMAGGGFTNYAEDYSGPGGIAAENVANSAVGGDSLVNVSFINNKYSTRLNICVGLYGVWFYRGSWSPYYGGPTDLWNQGGSVRSGNVVLETGENIDRGGPSGCEGYNSSPVPPASSSPAITSANSASATVGSPFSYQITASGSPTSYNATGLPAGLSIDTTSGLISGTPSAAGTSNVSLSAANASGTGSATLTLTIAAAASAWSNTAFASQSGSFTAAFDAIPSMANADIVIGLSSGPAAAYSDLAAAVRFNTAGTVDARNGGAYAALSTVTYAAGVSYHFRLVVNVSAHAYDVYVTPQGQSEIALGQAYAFRGEQAGVSSLANQSKYGASGDAAVSNFTIALPVAAPAITSAGAASGTVGSAFSYQIAASNSPTSFSATGLPAGLSVNTANGLISGTPSAAGSFNLALSATNSAGTGSAALVLTINSAPPASSGAVYYVDPTLTADCSGNYSIAQRSCSGSDGTAYHALAASYFGRQPGDTIYLRGGSYSETLQPTASGTWSQPILYAAYGSETVDLPGVSLDAVGDVRLQGLNAGSLSQWGITWTFDTYHRFGEFANGDYWTLGPVTINSMSPAFDGSLNGWEVNPTSFVSQGFDSRAPDFLASLVPALPYTAAPGASVVKALSLLTGTDKTFLKTAAVLSVVDSVPAGDGAAVFRPPYFGTSKPALVPIAGLQTQKLPSLAPTPSAPSLNATWREFQRVQLEHKSDWVGDQIHPTDNMPDYGAAIATRNNEGALRLMLNDPVAAKMDALIAYVQYGLDVAAMIGNGGHYPANGGHDQGKELVLSFASVMLNDQGLKNLVINSGADTFAENSTIYISTVAGRPLYGQTSEGFCSEQAYWNDVTGNLSSKTCRDPYGYIDGGVRPMQAYQGCCVSAPAKGAALAVDLFTDMLGVWNDSSGYLQYADRYVTVGAWTQPDVCAPADGVCSGGSNPGAYCSTATEDPNGNNSACTGGGTCALSMANYGKTFGPDGNGGCIKGGSGRFPLLQGAARDAGYYASPFVDEMWAAYRNQPLGAPPSITSSSTASGTVGGAFSYQITATNSPTSYNATGLPAGLSLNASNGLISGTPGAAGVSSVTIGASNSSGTGSATLTLTIGNPASGWSNASFASQFGAFTAAFDAVPSVANEDAVVGLSSGPAASYSDLAAIVRFNNTGTIDARNGGAYAALSTVTYAAGASYHFRLVVNVPAHTYDVYVTPKGQAEIALVQAYAFRTEQNALAFLANVAKYGASGDATVSNFAIVTPGAPPAITSAGSAAGTTGRPFSYQIEATNAPTAYSAAGLPAGLSINAASGLISGTPSAIGTFAVTLSATNSYGNGAATLSLTVSPPAWTNAAFASQSGSFTASFDAVPSMANEDAVVGLSSGPAAAYTDLAAAVRFNSAGAIDARNGDAYVSASTIAYAAGAPCHFRLVVNVPARSYDVYAAPLGQAEQLLGQGLAFRTEQAGVTFLANSAAYAATGDVAVSNFAVGAAGTTPPSASVTSPADGATVSGTIVVAASASANADAVTFFVDGSSQGVAAAAPYAFSWDTTQYPDGSHVLTAVASNAAGSGAASPAVTVNVSNSVGTLSVIGAAPGAGVAAATYDLAAPMSEALVELRLDTRRIPPQPSVQLRLPLPSGVKAVTLHPLAADPALYTAQVSGTSFLPQDFAAVGTSRFSLDIGTRAYAVQGQSGRIEPLLGGLVREATGGGASVIIAAGNITQSAQITINPMPADANGRRAAAMTRQNLQSLGAGRDILMVSSGSLTQATLTLPIDPSLLPKGVSLAQARIAYFNARTGAWEIQPNARLVGNALQTEVVHFSPYQPVILTPSSIAGLRDSYVYPNPAVAPNDPTIRASLGVVDQVDVTIFDVSGRQVHSGSVSGAPTGIAGGEYYYDYTWSGHKASGAYFAVIHGKKADGTTVRARTKFIVVR